MQIFFALFLPTISQAIQCNEGLKLRESASQCWDKNILQTLDPKTPRTALASLPGKVNSVQEACAKFFAVHILKGVFSKPSGD